MYCDEDVTTEIFRGTWKLDGESKINQHDLITHPQCVSAVQYVA